MVATALQFHVALNNFSVQGSYKEAFREDRYVVPRLQNQFLHFHRVAYSIQRSAFVFATGCDSHCNNYSGGYHNSSDRLCDIWIIKRKILLNRTKSHQGLQLIRAKHILPAPWCY